ncbi:uncharacterized protein METZ01_LOCUS421475, partial [marine metagenome]
QPRQSRHGCGLLEAHRLAQQSRFPRGSVCVPRRTKYDWPFSTVWPALLRVRGCWNCSPAPVRWGSSASVAARPQPHSSSCPPSTPESCRATPGQSAPNLAKRSSKPWMRSSRLANCAATGLNSTSSWPTLPTATKTSTNGPSRSPSKCSTTRTSPHCWSTAACSSLATPSATRWSSPRHGNKKRPSSTETRSSKSSACPRA